MRRIPNRVSLAAILLLIAIAAPASAGPFDSLPNHRLLFGGAILRPDDQGYTSYWQWGPGASIAFELLDEYRANGLLFRLEHAVLPERTEDDLGSPIDGSPWNLTTLTAVARSHQRLLGPTSDLAAYLDLGVGWGFHHFGAIDQRGRYPRHSDAQSLSGSLITLGLGAEFVAGWGMFVDWQADFWLESQTLTWKTTRVGFVRKLGSE